MVAYAFAQPLTSVTSRCQLRHVMQSVKGRHGNRKRLRQFLVLQCPENHYEAFDATQTIFCVIVRSAPRASNRDNPHIISHQRVLKNRKYGLDGSFPENDPDFARERHVVAHTAVVMYGAIIGRKTEPHGIPPEKYHKNLIR